MPGLFNPYCDHDPRFDQPDAVALRRDNLRRYLASYEAPPPVFLLAEAPGPWGCRFSGVPLTSESQLVDPAFPLTGRPSSLAEEPYQEYSARIYWRALQPHFPRFFTWNTVPFHPFKPEKPLSIRTPRQGEVNAFADLLQAMLAVLAPSCILAIGRKAEGALARIGVEAQYVRHPSQGGAVLFAEGVKAVFADLDA